MMRTSTFAFAAALGVSLAAPVHAGAPEAKAPVVRTREGMVSGVTEQGVKRFLGIHYGADTGGANRFLPPRPAPAWQGAKAADRMGDRCPQPPLNQPGALISFSDLPVSEDCLVLNVWAPAKPGIKRPVMLWLHGGGFAFGSASDKYYDGARLAAKEGVVVVSINHRLNGFGYLDLGPDAGAAYAGSANVGQLDIVAALAWVKANIAGFGGDPANVTLFGQSGGGGKISAALGMPAAKGLFAKAIIESGADPRLRTPDVALAQRDKVLAAAGLSAKDVLKLRDLPMADLIAAFAKAGLLGFGPIVDGAIIPAHPYDPAATPISADVPLLIGFTRDEMTTVLTADPGWPQTDDAKLAMVATMLTGSADRGTEAVALYRRAAPGDTPMHLLASLMTDQAFGQSARRLAERKAGQAAPVYLYRFDWKTPVREGSLRAPHGVEIPFVFDTVATAPELVGAGPSQDRMTEELRGRFAAFARTGTPNLKGRIAWPRYDAGRRATFIFDDPSRVIDDPDRDQRLFWEKQPQK
jgi:para-nitrobenzyl esterase